MPRPKASRPRPNNPVSYYLLLRIYSSHTLGWMSLVLRKVVTREIQLWQCMYERNLEYNNKVNKVDSLKDIVVEFVAYL